jgi:hypothetical protein
MARSFALIAVLLIATAQLAACTNSAGLKYLEENKSKPGTAHRSRSTNVLVAHFEFMIVVCRRHHSAVRFAVQSAKVWLWCCAPDRRLAV